VVAFGNAVSTPANELDTRALEPITLPEFRELVLRGEIIRGRLIPSGLILKAFEEAQQWIDESPKTRLRLDSCKVAGEAVRMKGPVFAAERQDGDVREHFKTRMQAFHLGMIFGMSNTEVDAEFILNNVNLPDRIILNNVIFSKRISFQGAVFPRLATFTLTKVRFKDSLDFSGALILGSLTFNDCQFNNPAYFFSLKLGKEANLNFTEGSFDAPLDFSESIVLGHMALEGIEKPMKLKSKVYLNRINKNWEEVAGELNVKNVEFHDSLYLDEGKWASVNFSEKQDGLHHPNRFSGFCDFRQGLFGAVDLTGAEFEKGGDFSNAVFLKAVSIEGIKLREPLRISWTQLEGKIRPVEDSQAAVAQRLSKQSYEEMERNFKRLDDLYSENECRLEKRTVWEGKGFQWALCGYWVRPVNTMVWLALALLFFWFVNFQAFRKRCFWHVGQRDTWYDFLPSSFQLAVSSAALKAKLPAGYGANKWARAIFWGEFVCIKFLVGEHQDPVHRGRALQAGLL
jgi:hypothetical protein